MKIKLKSLGKESKKVEGKKTLRNNSRKFPRIETHEFPDWKGLPRTQDYIDR